MRIRYAVSTMVFWWREHHLSLEQECEFLRSLGFGIELRPTIKGHSDCRYERRNWLRLKEATAGMLVCMYCRTDGPTLEEWQEQIECAKTLNAPIVVDLHSLCISQDLGFADWGFAAEVIQMAQAGDVMLCIETGSLPVVLQVGKKFDYLRYCLDTGYAHLDPDVHFNQYVDKLAEKITYLHLTDNYGALDDHESPGLTDGMPRENWDYLLNAICKYDNDIIGAFEMLPSMPGTMIRKGSDFLFNVAGWPGKPKERTGYDHTSYRPF